MNNARRWIGIGLRAAPAFNGRQPSTSEAFTSAPPCTPGIKDGRLAWCPETPNCVSSQARDRRHHVLPFVVHGTPSAAMRRLREIVATLPRTCIVEAGPNYLYARCAWPLLGQIDDIEFHAAGSVIHVRSASRWPFTDFGLNRRRVEAVRRRLESRF